jgi:FixJ family two-component response regulator
MTQAELVYIVDDDPAACESVAALVDSMGLRSRTFGSAEDLLTAFTGAERGCVVTDLRLKGMTGLELQEQLSQLGHRLPVIVISAYADVPIAVRAMQKGAVTLLQKPYRDQELWDAIRTALAKDSKEYQLGRRRKEIEERLNSLTVDERSVLDLLLQGKPNKAIAAMLKIGLRTVEARRQSIMRKMTVGSLAELVKTVSELELAQPGC